MRPLAARFFCYQLWLLVKKGSKYLEDVGAFVAEGERLATGFCRGLLDLGTAR